ncbi:MAG: hypothetical protein ABR552_02835 [Actinomycetota bacterium]|nr:hypothetical protein [Actinomycetota bacterium]
MAAQKRGYAMRTLAVLVGGVFLLISAGSLALATPKGGHAGTNHASTHAHGNSVHSSDSTNTRGKSPSRPDQDGIGMDRGLVNDDKPPSGDGNNGCGNDADREDDNNGWCGHKPAPTVTATATETVGGVTVTPSESASVLGLQITRNSTTTQPASASVLGTSLARTGLSIAALLAAAAAFIAAGVMLSRRSRAPAR